MIVLGIDPHKKSHTVVALEAATGEMLGSPGEGTATSAARPVPFDASRDPTPKVGRHQGCGPGYDRPWGHNGASFSPPNTSATLACDPCLPEGAARESPEVRC